MPNYFIANNLATDNFPWAYIDEGENRVYLLSFIKTDLQIENALWESYYAQQERRHINSDAEASDYLNIINLKANVFTSNAVNRIEDTKMFVETQLGGSNNRSLYSLVTGIYYQHQVNNSFNLDGTKKLHLQRIYASGDGVVTLPTEFVFDKAQSEVNTNFAFSYSPFLHVVVGLDTSGVSNSCLIFHYNSARGFYCNKALTSTSNVHNTLVNFLPAINLSSSSNSLYSDTVTPVLLTANVTYSNNFPYPSAQTRLLVDTNVGFVTQKTPPANSSATVSVFGMMANIGANVIISAGWDNYLNAANLNLGVAGGVGAQTYILAGTYTFAVPNFHTLKVKVWGGGGGGADALGNGNNGGQSSFNGTVIAKGGFGGTTTENGLGDVATGGNTNMSGNPGSVLGFGGNAPGQGGGGSGGGPLNTGSPYGGGGGTGNTLNEVSGSGASGAYAERIYSNNEISGNVTVIVGIAGHGNTTGANGAPGAVIIEWT